MTKAKAQQQHKGKGISKSPDMMKSSSSSSSQANRAVKALGGKGIHCLRCKDKTPDGVHTYHKTQKGGNMIKTTCQTCKSKKCRFVGKGFWDNVSDGLSTAASAAAPYVKAAQPYLSTAATLAPLLL